MDDKKGQLQRAFILISIYSIGISSWEINPINIYTCFYLFVCFIKKYGPKQEMNLFHRKYIYILAILCLYYKCHILLRDDGKLQITVSLLTSPINFNRMWMHTTRMGLEMLKIYRTWCQKRVIYFITNRFLCCFTSVILC